MYEYVCTIRIGQQMSTRHRDPAQYSAQTDGWRKKIIFADNKTGTKFNLQEMIACLSINVNTCVQINAYICTFSAHYT